MCEVGGVGVRAFDRCEDDGNCVEGGGVMLLRGFDVPVGSGACDSSGVVGSGCTGGTARLSILPCDSKSIFDVASRWSNESSFVRYWDINVGREGCAKTWINRTIK